MSKLTAVPQPDNDVGDDQEGQEDFCCQERESHGMPYTKVIFSIAAVRTDSRAASHEEAREISPRRGADRKSLCTLYLSQKLKKIARRTNSMVSLTVRHLKMRARFVIPLHYLCPALTVSLGHFSDYHPGSPREF